MRGWYDASANGDTGRRGSQNGVWRPGPAPPTGTQPWVRLIGQADLPLIDPPLSALAGLVTITVESQARAELSTCPVVP